METAALSLPAPTRHDVLMSEQVAQRWSVAWWVGLAGHLVMLLWYAASGLVAPPWAVVGLLAIWAALLLVGLRLRAARPLWMLAIPVLDVAIWFGAISAGDAFLGWTA
jgi:hypothetical protein